MSSPEWASAAPELRTALGDMVLAFSELEESLRNAIWLLVGVEGLYVDLLTYRMPFVRMAEKFGELFPLRYPACERKGLDKFCDALRKVASERNDMIHSLWEFDEEQGTALLHKRAKDRVRLLRLNTRDVSPENVRELVKRISQLDNTLWQLYVDQRPVT